MQVFKNIFLLSSLFLTISICASSQGQNTHPFGPKIDDILSRALHEKESEETKEQREADERNQEHNNEINHRNQLLQTYKITKDQTDLEGYLVAQSKHFYSKHQWTFLSPAGAQELGTFTLENGYRRLASLVQTKHNHIQNYILESAEEPSHKQNFEDQLLALDYDISFFDKISLKNQTSEIVNILHTNQLQYLPRLLKETRAHTSCYLAALKLIHDRRLTHDSDSGVVVPQSLNNGVKITNADVLLSNLCKHFNINSTKDGNNLLMDSIAQGARCDDVQMLMDKGINLHHENVAEKKNAVDVAIIRYLQSYEINTWDANYKEDKATEANLLGTITLLAHNNLLAHDTTIATCVKNMVDKKNAENAQFRKQRYQNPGLIQERMNQLKTIPVSYK